MSSSTSFSQNNKNDSLEHYNITDKLSSSKYSVYKGFNTQLSQEVALKFFPFNGFTDKNYSNEVANLKKLNHPNIIKMIENVPESSAVLEREEKQVSYISFEYAAHGDLFEVISKHGRMPEIICRTLFRQLVEATEYMHSQDVAHLDLKLENLLFDKDCNIKITDFDLSQSMESTYLIARGTPGYRAPEVKKGVCYNFKAADVYSLATILFIMITGTPAYAEVNKGLGLEFDGFYKLMRKNNKKFWELHASYKNDPDFYSEDLIDLINGMLIEEPRQRLTLEDVKNSKWYQGPVLDKETYQTQIKEYIQN